MENERAAGRTTYLWSPGCGSVARCLDRHLVTQGGDGRGWKSGILRNLKAQILSAPCPMPEGARDLPSKAVKELKEPKKKSKSGSFAVFADDGRNRLFPFVSPNGSAEV